VPEIIVATPLDAQAVSRPYQFSDGVSIRQLPSIRWDVSIVRQFISEKEREAIEKTRYWLCVSREVARPSDQDTDFIYELAHYALWTIQIICPSGAKCSLLKFWNTAQGYDNIGSLHPRELEGTLLSKRTRLEDCGLRQQFECIYSYVKRAFEEKVVRLQNPVLLLEHSMQAGNPNLSALMAVMGLDILMMAGNISNFVPRLGGFLGPTSPVFAPPSDKPDGPVITVQEVIEDLYDFRNIIAHGNEIPEHPWRERRDLLDKYGSRLNFGDYYYCQLLRDCGIYFITRVLRQLFVDQMFDKVKDTHVWKKQWLQLYERRWRDQVNPPRRERSKLSTDDLQLRHPS
jgi:hypothetical protein